MSLSDAASSGDRLSALRALRDTLASHIETSESPRDVAALSGQLTQVLKQIEELDKGRVVHASKVDELAARRKMRAKPIRNGDTREA